MAVRLKRVLKLPDGGRCPICEEVGKVEWLDHFVESMNHMLGHGWVFVAGGTETDKGDKREQYLSVILGEPFE